MTDAAQVAKQGQPRVAFSILLAASTLTWWHLLTWAFAPTTGYAVNGAPLFALILFAGGVAIAVVVGQLFRGKAAALGGLVLGVPLALLVFTLTSGVERALRDHAEKKRLAQITSTLAALVHAGEDDRSPAPKLPPAVAIPDLFSEVADRMYPTANYYGGFPFGPELSFDQWLLAARGAMRLDVPEAHKKQAMYQVLMPLVGAYRQKKATPSQAATWFALWKDSFPADTVLSMNGAGGFSSARYGYRYGSDDRIAWDFLGSDLWINAWLSSGLRVNAKALAVFWDAARKQNSYQSLDMRTYFKLQERAEPTLPAPSMASARR